jgi:hypothetical protein
MQYLRYLLLVLCLFLSCVIVATMPSSKLLLDSPAATIISCFILFPLFVISTVAFTEPCHIGLRFAVVVIAISQALQYQRSMHRISKNKVVNGIVAQFLWVYIIRSFDLLLYRKARIFPRESAVKLKTTKNGQSMLQQDGKAESSFRRPTMFQFWQSFYLFFTLRDIGTPHAIKHIPPFSTSNPTWIPSRTSFLLQHMCIAVIGYLVADIPSILPPTDPQQAAQMSLPVFSRLLDIRFEEVISRLIITASSWIFAAAILSSFYSFIAVLFVGLGFSEPRFWPPQFSSLEHSYTLRGWWG